MKFDAAWRRQRREEHDASLDDLLLFGEDEATATTSAAATRRPWVARAGLIAFAAAAVIYTVSHAFDLAPPFPLIFGVCAGAVLVRRAVSMTKEPYPHRTRDVTRPRPQGEWIDLAGWFDTEEGVIDGVRRWDRRLDWGATAPERFATTVATRVGELADERLRQRYGFSRDDDPQRARRLLGEQLWTLLHDKPRRVPSAREMSEAISALERL